MKRLSSIVLICLFFGSVAPSFALSKEYQITLKGLKEIYVYAENPLVKTHAELRLRQVGLSILAEDGWTKASGKPHLSIFVAPGTIEVELYQDVFLARQPKIGTWVQTWSIATHSCKDNSEIEVDRYIDKFLDEFINDYLAVNPK